jgi:hypothetical protein
MNSEKVKEIKKALANWHKDICLDCPYFLDEKRCRPNDLLFDTLTLINELESEKERLSKQLPQFAERLKEMAYKSTDWSHGEHPLVVEVDYIDEVLEEFLNK